MFELLVVGAVGFVLVAVFGLFAALASLLWWLVLLPFKLIAFTFKGVAALLLLPFMLLFGLVGFLLLGAGMLAFFVPALPFVLIAALVWTLFRRREKSTATVV
jgi:hypothetical protein